MLVKATPKTCKKCIYSIRFSTGQLACDYICRTEHSRIFEGREKRYDPAYCDKYTEGEKPKQVNTPFTAKGIKLNEAHRNEV